MSEPRWLNEEEQQLWLEFREFLWGYPSAMDRQLTRDAGMSSGEYSVLAAVSQSAPDALRSGRPGRDPAMGTLAGLAPACAAWRPRA